jgi:hypothetical protein
MYALTYASNSPTAAPRIGDQIAELLARVVGLALALGGRGLARLGAFAYAPAGFAPFSPAFGFLVTQDVSQGASDVAEPSTAELLARLAALRDNIRRARQHYGLDDRVPQNGGRDSSNDARDE